MTLAGVEADLSQLRESSVLHKKRSMEMMLNLLKELGEMSQLVGADFKVD